MLGFSRNFLVDLTVATDPQEGIELDLRVDRPWRAPYFFLTIATDNESWINLCQR
jgi:hypothetical protein